MPTGTVVLVADDPILEMAEESIYAIVRGAGGRLTVPMRVVVALLVDSDRHPTADDLIAAVNERITGISPSTIYRVLSRLDELDVIEHVHSGTGPAFYQLRQHSHVHLVCNSCGTITNIPEAAFDDVRKSLLAAYKFTLQPRHAALLGQCEQCAATGTHAEHAADIQQHTHQHPHAALPTSPSPNTR
jgi:Fur family ferric uptake transcriptional regulator